MNLLHSNESSRSLERHVVRNYLHWPLFFLRTASYINILKDTERNSWKVQKTIRSHGYRASHFLQLNGIIFLFVQDAHFIVWHRPKHTFIVTHPLLSII